MAMGDSALVETGGVEIVLISLRNQAMGTDLFTQLGCALETKKLIVVKSSQHFYASFSKVAPTAHPSAGGVAPLLADNKEQLKFQGTLR